MSMVLTRPKVLMTARAAPSSPVCPAKTRVPSGLTATSVALSASGWAAMTRLLSVSMTAIPSLF
jgi:hypothetical protein